MDLSFPGQRTTTATLCIPHDSVYMPGPHAGKSENGFFLCDTWLQIFQNDSKICEAEVTVTPLINNICKPCIKLTQYYNKFKRKEKGEKLAKGRRRGKNLNRIVRIPLNKPAQKALGSLNNKLQVKWIEDGLTWSAKSHKPIVIWRDNVTRI